MKKLNLIFLCLLALSFTFTGCKTNPVNPIEVIEDGLYLSGDATTSADLKTENLMANGINENGQVARAGMYEKYIALEANKNFTITQVKGSTKTVYGATLTLTDSLQKANGDQPKEKAYKGTYSAGGAAMKVSASGLYHVVMEDSLKTLVITPVKWGVRGNMNNWGFTAFAAPTFNKSTMTYTMENVKVEGAGGWKFSYGSGWKIFLDDNQKVRVNTNLGNNLPSKDENKDLMGTNLKQGGPNIGIARGIYKIALTWNLKDGTVGKNFVATLTKTGDIAAINFSNVELELVGAGIASTNAGAIADTYWNWGYRLPAGKPTANGNIYTWTWNSVALVADGFKIRTLTAAASGGVAAFDLGADKVDATKSVAGISTTGDIKVATAGNYKIVLTIDAAADTKTIVITKI